MNASIVELRYKMRDVLSALERKEKVSILYHGKLKGIIYPLEAESSTSVQRHPFFGMAKSKESVETTMRRIRGVRYS
jgi:hypothetical protein